MSNVYAIETTRTTKSKSKAQRRHLTKAAKRQRFAATMVGLVVMALTGLSLTHLSHGIEVVTNASAWEAWAMAVGIDLGFVVLEVADLSAVETTRRKIEKWIKPAIIGTLTGSAALNAFAFAANATGWYVYPAAVLGVAITALIYAMTRVGTTMAR